MLSRTDDLHLLIYDAVLGIFLPAFSMDCPCSSQHSDIRFIHTSGLECLHCHSTDSCYGSNALLFSKVLFILEVSYSVTNCVRCVYIVQSATNG